MVFFTALLMGLVCGFVLAGDHERFFTLRLGRWFVARRR